MRGTGPTTRTRSALVEPGRGLLALTPWSEVARLLVTRAQTAGAFTVTEVEAPAGWQRPTYVHHALDECLYVVEGEVEAELDDQDRPVRVPTGALLFVPRGVGRSLRNPGRVPGRLLLLQTPGRDEDVPPATGVEFVTAPVPASAPRPSRRTS